MSFRDEPSTRASMRSALSLYMSQSVKSVEQISRYIEEYRLDIAPDAKSTRAAIDHETITRFLADGTKTHRDKVEILYRFLVHVNKIVDPDIRFHNRPGTDPVFQVIQHFFGGARNVEFCKSVIGTYRIFFRSEDLRGYVVVGAMEFSLNQAGSALEVTEHQKNRLSDAIENWSGYYLARSRNHLVIMLRGQEHLDSMPKFYILHTPHSNQGKLVTEVRGKMFKIGSEGGIFLADVLLRRDDEAFAKCDILPNNHTDIPDDVLGQI